VNQHVVEKKTAILMENGSDSQVAIESNNQSDELAKSTNDSLVVTVNASQVATENASQLVTELSGIY